MALTSLQFHELAFIFGILGNIVSFGVCLAPLPTFWSIYRKKSTQGFQAIPYSVALFSAMLLLYYAFVKEKDGTMIITINSIVCLIEASYLALYLFYAPKKARMYTAKLLGLFNVTFFGLIVLITMSFTKGDDHHHIFSRGGNREKVVGWICAIFSVSVFAAPLSVMRMVIRTKSVEFMPFWLSFSLTLCAIMWFFYGFLIHDFYIALPNILGFTFGVIQMILYILYKDSIKKSNHNMMKEEENVDIKRLQQELAVDIKLTKIEDTQQISDPKHNTINTNTNTNVVEINVEELGVSDSTTTNTNTQEVGEIIHENNVKVDEKVANGEPPRGDDSNV